jgi:hypothetical protein
MPESHGRSCQQGCNQPTHTAWADQAKTYMYGSKYISHSSVFSALVQQRLSVVAFSQTTYFNIYVTGTML